MARAIAVASGTTDVQGITGSATLVGFSVRAAGAATVTFRNGTTATDPIVGYYDAGAAGSVVTQVPAVDCPNGVFVDRGGASATELVIYVA